MFIMSSMYIYTHITQSACLGLVSEFEFQHFVLFHSMPNWHVYKANNCLCTIANNRTRAPTSRHLHVSFVHVKTVARISRVWSENADVGVYKSSAIIKQYACLIDVQINNGLTFIMCSLVFVALYCARVSHGFCFTCNQSHILTTSRLHRAIIDRNFYCDKS